MANDFVGDYKTQRDGGLTYYYKAMWIRRGKDVLWRATVRFKTRHVGDIEGRVVNAPSDSEVSPLVQAQIASHIESKIR